MLFFWETWGEWNQALRRLRRPKKKKKTYLVLTELLISSFEVTQNGIPGEHYSLRDQIFLLKMFIYKNE